MPQGEGTYGKQVGRPPLKKLKSGFKMKGFEPFNDSSTPYKLFSNPNKARKMRGGEGILKSGRDSGVTRKFKEQPDFKKSNFRKKIESGKGWKAKLFGGKREDDVYKPGIADFRLFGGIGHRNLKKGDTAANVKKTHSPLTKKDKPTKSMINSWKEQFSKLKNPMESNRGKSLANKLLSVGVDPSIYANPQEKTQPKKLKESIYGSKGGWGR